MTQADEKNTKTPQKPWKMEHDVTWQHFRRVLTHHWGVVFSSLNSLRSSAYFRLFNTIKLYIKLMPHFYEYEWYGTSSRVTGVW